MAKGDDQKLPYPPKIREMVEETNDLLYIAEALQKRTKKYLSELSHIQNVNNNKMVRAAARAQYNALVTGGKISITKFVDDLKSSLRAIDRAVKDRISDHIRTAAVLQLAKANTTRKLANAVRDLEKKESSKRKSGRR